jgi:hypothetical protein
MMEQWLFGLCLSGDSHGARQIRIIKRIADAVADDD